MGFIRSWIFKRVIKSALVFEWDATAFYLRLKGDITDSVTRQSIDHLLEEEQLHRQMLADITERKLSGDRTDEILDNHPFHQIETIQPLSENTLSRWKGDLERTLEQEERTFIFYSNLQRISKIPAVKKAFQVLSAMEREHWEVLKRLLGAETP